MSLLNAPSGVSFSDDTTTARHFKSFINFIYEQTKLHGDKTFARYIHENEYKSLTYDQVDKITTYLAVSYPWATSLLLSGEPDAVVSYINDHSIDYLLTLLALMKLRVALFTISPRNSQGSVQSLMESTNSKLIIVGEKYEQLAKDAISTLPDTKCIVLQKLDIETLLLKEPHDTSILNRSFSDDDILKPVLIFHR